LWPNLIVIAPHDLGDFLGGYDHAVDTFHIDAALAELG